MLLDNDKWYLIYQLRHDDQKAGRFFIGGAPQNQPQLTSELRSKNWIIPNDLVTFYKIHNGFGLLWPFDMFWNSDCVLPDHKLWSLSKVLSSVSGVDVDYNTKDLLEFFPDGSGNGQYFYRSEIGKDVDLTVDWDHETRELSKEQVFWQFLDDRLSNLIEL